MKQYLSFLTRFFKSLPLQLLTVHHIYEISEMTTHERRTIVTRLRSLMDFSLRCVRFYPGVNSHAELVTLAPGLRPERRSGISRISQLHYHAYSGAYHAYSGGLHLQITHEQRKR